MRMVYNTQRMDHLGFDGGYRGNCDFYVGTVAT